MTENNQSQINKLFQGLLHLEEAAVPMEDFVNTLKNFALMDRFVVGEAQAAFESGMRAPAGLHGVDHTLRVVFWVQYLVAISNRLGYVIGEDDAFAAELAALIHDLTRVDDLPGGVHGKTASKRYESYLSKYLAGNHLERCLAAVACHGYADDPKEYDPIWMLLKDADALDRARFAAPGKYDGCDPNRLRLPVLKENTPILDVCLVISDLLPKLIFVPRPDFPVFQLCAERCINRINEETETNDDVNRQIARLCIERYHASDR